MIRALQSADMSSLSTMVGVWRRGLAGCCITACTRRTIRATPLMANTNILMLYLLAVLWIAMRYSRGAAMVASVLGVMAFDFCFVPHYLTLRIADTQYVITFGVMLATALVISTLTYRAAGPAQAARASLGAHAKQKPQYRY